MTRLHPEDLRAIVAASIHGGSAALIQGQQLQFCNRPEESICEADILLSELARTAKPEPEQEQEGAQWCSYCLREKAMGHDKICPKAKQGPTPSVVPTNASGDAPAAPAGSTAEGSTSSSVVPPEPFEVLPESGLRVTNYLDKIVTWGRECARIAEDMKAIADYRLEQVRTRESQLATLQRPDIDAMVDRFLGWKLPEDFAPDGGISFKATYNDHLPVPMKHNPIGTNLLTAIQAKAMFEYATAQRPADDPDSVLDYKASSRYWNQCANHRGALLIEALDYLTDIPESAVGGDDNAVDLCRRIRSSLDRDTVVAQRPAGGGE